MATQRDDIAGLIEALRERARELYGQTRYKNYFDEAATQLDVLLKERDALTADIQVKAQAIADLGRAIYQCRSERDALQARVKELEAERDKWDRRTAYDELKAREFENRATQQRQIDALTIRAEAAEARALRAERELDTMNDNHRAMAGQLARIGQDRDEASDHLDHIEGGLQLLAAAVKAGDPQKEILWRVEEELRHIATIRQLAGPEKEGDDD